jgi:hypothetical protein
MFFHSFSYFIIFTLTYMCIHCLGNLPSSPSPHLQQNLFHPIVLWFCGGENIGDNKKDIMFLLVWDKDTERFLALIPCTCVLQHILVHLCQTSSLFPGPLPIVASASLILFYLHISHIQVLGFLPFPYSSCMHSPLSMGPMSNNIIAFVWGL